MDLDPMGAGANRVVDIFAQIGRYGLALLGVVAARKSLPGEVISRDRKIAGEFLYTLAQHGHGIAVGRGYQLVILGRRYAKRIKRNRCSREEADRFVVEKRCDGAFEMRPLLIGRARCDETLELFAMQAGNRVQHADETTEQPVAIEVARKHVD